MSDKILSDRERMIAGKLYNSVDPSLIKDRTRARLLTDKFNRTKAWDLTRRNKLIRKLIPNHGKNFFFEPTIHMEYGYNITFGDDFYMNYDCQLLDVCPIKIGNGVMFGPRVIVATPCHPLVGDERIIQQYPDGMHDLEFGKPVEIGDNCWIASNVTICGGVRIGSDTVIAAGSVVTRDIPSGVLAAGVPCKVIRKITDEDRIRPWETYMKDGAREK